MISLAGKTVLVTGGAVRVGAYICRAFAAQGARLVIHCLHSRDAAEMLCRELGGPGKGHSVAVCDLADRAAAAEMIRQYAPDVLVNNAARYARASVMEEDATEAHLQYEVNFLTPAAMIRTLAEVRGERETVVINMLDSDIRRTDRASFSYALSKKTLAAATRAAALQCAPFLRVNAVAPGPMIPPENLKHLGMRRTSARLPLKRGADPADAAEAAVFLARCPSVTGAVLYVDCGQALLGSETEDVL